MADTVVLAEISIDSSGVVTGVGVAKNSLQEVGAATDKFSEAARKNTGFVDKLSERIFSLRHAAIALIGSFSLAGIIFELKGFLEGVIKSDAAFGELQQSAAQLKSEFIAISRESLGVSAGIQEVTVWMDRLNAVMQTIQGISGGKGESFIQSVLFAEPGVGVIVAELEALGAAIDKNFGDKIKQIQAARGPGGVSLLEEWTANLKAAEEGLAGLEKGGIGTVAPGFKLIDDVVAKIATRLPDALTAAEEAANPLKETWQDLSQFTDEIASGWTTAADELAAIQEGDITSKMASQFRQVSENARLAASAIVAVGQSITQHILAGGLTFKNVFADMLMSMVPVLLGLAAIHFLEYDFAGAAYAFAAAVAAATAAKALGAGAKQYGGGAGGPTAVGTSGNTSLQVTFAGPTFGFNEAMFARYVTDLQRRGERSNS